MRKGILDVNLYEGHEKELMLGCLAALASSAIWLLVATFLKLPISGKMNSYLTRKISKLFFFFNRNSQHCWFHNRLQFGCSWY